MSGVGLGEVPVVELVNVMVELGVETVGADDEAVLEDEELTDWAEGEPVLDSGEEVLEELLQSWTRKWTGWCWIQLKEHLTAKTWSLTERWN
jgi:hypothetical protein